MELIQQAWLWFLHQLASGSVAVCLVTGAVFLIASALILGYTRIGQSRPVLTCAALSVVAHLLLLVMASRVIFERPLFGTGGGETASINVIDDISEDPESGDPAPPHPDGEDVPPQAWALAPSEQLIPSPEINDLPRPDNEAELVIEREPPQLPELVSSGPPPTFTVPDLPPADQTDGTPVRPVPDVAEPPMIAAETASPAPPTPIEVPRLAADSRPAPDPSRLAGEPGELPPVESMTAADALLRGVDQPAAPKPDALVGEVPPAMLPVPSLPALALPIPDASAPGPDRNTVDSARRLADAMAAPLRAATDVPLPLEYSLRNSSRRGEVVLRNGGSTDTEAAVAAALRWLAAQQSSDGRWNPRQTGAGVEQRILGQDRQRAGETADTGITGLALLAFLSAGHTHRDGQYADTVQRGLQFLQSIQAADGSLAGDARMYERTYCHSMAMLAVGEAVAMTGDESLRRTLANAVHWSVHAQNRIDGGWRYQPGDPGDMSQFGWQVLGLKSAGLAGITTPRETREGMLRFLHHCTLGEHRGLGCYRPGERPTPTMTAEALVCRYLLEQSPDPATVREATAMVMRNLPQDATADYYYWYYATMAMFQTGGEPWERWNAALTPVLLARQASDGPETGSFAADRAWSTYGGRVFSTAMATLCLEVYYRYMPVYEALRQSPTSPQR